MNDAYIGPLNMKTHVNGRANSVMCNKVFPRMDRVVAIYISLE